MPEFILQLGVAGLAVFLMYRLSNDRMKEMTVALNALTEVIHSLKMYLSKNDCSK